MSQMSSHTIFPGSLRPRRRHALEGFGGGVWRSALLACGEGALWCCCGARIG
jgi:hypothetical protein